MNGTEQQTRKSQRPATFVRGHVICNNKLWRGAVAQGKTDGHTIKRPSTVFNASFSLYRAQNDFKWMNEVYSAHSCVFYAVFSKQRLHNLLSRPSSPRGVLMVNIDCAWWGRDGRHIDFKAIMVHVMMMVSLSHVFNAVVWLSVAKWSKWEM